MKFLEKSLETILWEHPYECQQLGFDIAEIGWSRGMESRGEGRLRQMNLGPYGIADIVAYELDVAQRVLRLQIIECKRDRIDLATYLQAMRYLAGLKHCFRQSLGITDENYQIIYEVVLVGRHFDTRDGLPFILNEDKKCRVFTYDYGVDGICFDEVGRGWQRGSLDTARFNKAVAQPAAEYLHYYTTGPGFDNPAGNDSYYARHTPFMGIVRARGPYRRYSHLLEDYY